MAQVEGLKGRCVSSRSKRTLSGATVCSDRILDANGRGTIRDRPVVAETGLDGVGYTYAGDSGGLWLRDGIEQLLAPRLHGTSVLAIEESWERIFRDLLLLGRRGALVRMLSAVEIAVWDLFARIRACRFATYSAEYRTPSRPMRAAGITGPAILETT